MGKKSDLSKTEKTKIVQMLAEGNKTVEISNVLGRDHRTIKRFVAQPQDTRKKRVEKKRRTLSAKDLRRIGREVKKNPLATSATIFENCNLADVPRSTRCNILREVADVKKAQKRPPLNKKHKEKRLEWARTYLKMDFSKVLWTDEMRVTLDGPDGWARGWITKGHNAPVRLRRQQGGGGVMVWAGIINKEVVGPFRVAEGVKINSENYCQFLESTFFKRWFNKKSASLRKNLIFMQDNAPSHASKYSKAWLAQKGIKDDRLMTWPPCSPDLNPIENFWALVKQYVYVGGRQYSSKEDIWDAVQAASTHIRPEQVMSLTTSVDNRLLLVLEKKGGYISK